MPRRDGTGPASLGPKTGRGAGYCNGFPTPGASKAPRHGIGGFGRWVADLLPGLGRDSGRGSGLGRGQGRNF